METVCAVKLLQPVIGTGKLGETGWFAYKACALLTDTAQGAGRSESPAGEEISFPFVGGSNSELATDHVAFQRQNESGGMAANGVRWIVRRADGRWQGNNWEGRTMRTSLFWSLVAVCLVSSGCSITGKGITGKFFRTVLWEPAVYCDRKDDARSRSRYDQLGEIAWIEVRNANAEMTFSPHFEQGFKEGYSEYLYAGGSSTPPPVPPRRYWNDRWQTPEGHVAIGDWYAGYHEGVALAVSQGCRHYAVVPGGANAPAMVCRLPEVVDPAVLPEPAEP